MRDALAPDFCRSDFSRDAFGWSSKVKGFRSPLALELLSLCVAKEKVTKEKGHPAFAPCGHPARKVRGRATGFVDSTSCADAKLAGIHAGHPAGFSFARPPLQRGPGVKHRAIVARTRCAAAAPLRERRGVWFSVLLLTSVRPERSRVAAESKGGACGCPSTSAFGLRSGRTVGAGGSASASALAFEFSFAFAFALAPSRVWARMARGFTRGPCAPSGVAFSFGYFSLGHAREK